MDLSEIKLQAAQMITEVLELARLNAGEILVAGCSTSAVTGARLGENSVMEVGACIFDAIHARTKERGVYLAAQCCEHLNRAIIIEEEAMLRYNLDRVSVVPQKKAGGSFAASAYLGFAKAVAVEYVSAHAGVDIGGTLIGMHLTRSRVAVPLKLAACYVGETFVTAARTRLRYIGGERAVYDESLC